MKKILAILLALITLALGTFLVACDEEETPNKGNENQNDNGSSNPPSEEITVTDIVLNNSALTLYVSDKSTLTAVITPQNATDKNVTWSSSNEAVVTVDNGVITAVSCGTATITVKTTNGKTATCTVTVVPPTTGLRYGLNLDQTYSVIGLMDSCEDINIVIPNEYNGKPVTKITTGAFKDRTWLTSITIPNSVTSIGDEAFSGCTGLKGVYISDIASWCEIDFDNYSSNPLYYANNLYLNGTLVTELVIPDSVTSINDYAFYDCSNITNVTIPDSVTSIGERAFQDCSGLTSVTIGNSVTSIGDYAFYGCTGLTSITIPNSITSIGSYAFYNCNGLTSIKYRGTQEQWKAISKIDYWNYNTGEYITTYNYQ